MSSEKNYDEESSNKKREKRREDSGLLGNKITRRNAIGKAVAVGVGVVVAGAVAGTAGYLVGQSGVTTTGATTTVTGTPTTVTSTVTQSGAAAGGEPQSIALATWTGGETDAVEYAAGLYKTTHPGVTINITDIPETGSQAVTMAALQSPNAPDIIFDWPIPGLNEVIVTPGYALNLDKYANGLNWNTQTVTSASAANTTQITGLNFVYPNFLVDGHTYWLNFAGNLYGLIAYNKTVLDKIGVTTIPPKTMDDMYSLVATAKAAGYLGLVHGYNTVPEWMHNQFSIWMMNLMSPADYKSFWTSYGPDLTTAAFANRTIKWTDDTVVGCFQLLADWRDKVFAPGITSMTDASAVSTFTSQKAVMYTAGMWIASTLIGPVGGAFEYTCYPILAPPPVGSSTGKARVVITGFPHFVNAKTKSPNLCVDFLNSLFSSPVQQYIMKFDGLLPTIAMDPAQVVTDPHTLQVYANSLLLEYGPSLASAQSTKLHDPVEAAIASVLDASATPQQAASTVEQTAIRINSVG